jgi:hypothetical protein
MGRFHKNIGVLAPFGAPLFVLMKEEGIPLPVSPEAFYRWANKLPKGQRGRAYGAYKELRMSERYSRAIAAEGAMRHDMDAQPTGPVSEEGRAMALKNIAAIEAMRAARNAANGQT